MRESRLAKQEREREAVQRSREGRGEREGANRREV